MIIENLFRLLDIWNNKKKNISQKNKVIFIKEKDILTPHKSEESPEGICKDSISKKSGEVKC